MADLSITAANVGVASSTCKTVTVQAGEAITRGMAVYLDGTNSNKAMKALNTAAASTTIYGIANDEAAADGDYISVITTGTIKTGASMTVGQAYYLSTNAGKICPFADLNTSDYINLVYRAATSTTAKMVLENSGIQSP
tara:strand:- start:5986 stop:6402 length:417 start_codon:yes stop_codon:yes gene_type:complete